MDERSAINSVSTGLFINGRWESTEKTMPVIDPSTGKALCEIADASPAEGAKALDAAAAGQADWAATPPRERSEILYRAYDLIEKDAERLGCGPVGLRCCGGVQCLAPSAGEASAISHSA